MVKSESRRKAHLQKAGEEQLKQEDQDGGDVSAVGSWREKRADSSVFQKGLVVVSGP